MRKKKSRGNETFQVIEGYKADGLTTEDALYGMRVFGFDYNSHRGQAIGLGVIAFVAGLEAIIEQVRAKKVLDRYEAYYDQLVEQRRLGTQDGSNDIPIKSREDNND